jgi:hypothetical protein
MPLTSALFFYLICTRFDEERKKERKGRKEGSKQASKQSKQASKQNKQVNAITLHLQQQQYPLRNEEQEEKPGRTHEQIVSFCVN